MKQANKRRLIVAVFVVIILAAVSFLIIMPRLNKTKAPTATNPTTFSKKAKEALDNKDYPEAVENYEKAIEVEPKVTENYVDKSTAEYASGDKEAAKTTVEEGLKQDPNNELLKARLDALEKGTFDSSAEAERQ